MDTLGKVSQSIAKQNPSTFFRRTYIALEAKMQWINQSQEQIEYEFGFRSTQLSKLTMIGLNIRPGWASGPEKTSRNGGSYCGEVGTFLNMASRRTTEKRTEFLVESPAV